MSAVIENIAAEKVQEQDPGQIAIDDVFSGTGVDANAIDASAIYPDISGPISQYTIALGFKTDFVNPTTVAQEYYGAGLASDPLPGAQIIPVVKPGIDNPITVNDAHGSLILGDTGGFAPELKPALFPDAFGPEFFVTRGSYDAVEYHDMYQRAVDLFTNAPPGPDGDKIRLGVEVALFTTTPLGNFKPGGIWDAQRFNTVSGTEYTPAASIYIGEYAAEVGIPRDMIQQINNDLFAAKSMLGYLIPKFALPDQPMAAAPFNATPIANVHNIDTGYQLIQQGFIHR